MPVYDGAVTVFKQARLNSDSRDTPATKKGLETGVSLAGLLAKGSGFPTLLLGLRKDSDAVLDMSGLPSGPETPCWTSIKSRQVQEGNEQLPSPANQNILNSSRTHF